MSRWQEIIDSHAIHETIKNLKALATTKFEDVDEDEIPERRRIIKVLNAYEEAISRLDAELVPINQLDSLNAALKHQNLFGQMTNYANNKNVAHLVAANDQLSNQLTQLSLLMSIAGLPTAEIAVNDLEENIDYISNTLIERKNKLAVQIEGLSNSVSKSQQELSQLGQQIEKRREEVDSQLSQWQQQFSEAQERRNTEFSAWRDNVNKEVQNSTQEMIAEADEELKKYKLNFEENITKILEDGNKKHQAILELYELTAGDSVGAGYLKSADDERKQANLWRWISVGFILVTVAWLFYAYCHSTGAVADGGILWSKLATIISLTGVLLFGAAFSSQQSNKHRANEKRSSWFALQVKAIDPFINSLETKERNELKRLLSERLFGNAEEIGEGGSTIISEHALNVIVKSITDILGKVPKG